MEWTTNLTKGYYTLLKRWSNISFAKMLANDYVGIESFGRRTFDMLNENSVTRELQTNRINSIVQNISL